MKLLFIVFFYRFTVAVSACYTYPSLVCSRPNRGLVHVVANTCPIYSGGTQATISPDLSDGSRVFTISVRDPDSDQSTQLNYQIIGDEASVRDFTIDSQGNIRTRASYRDSFVSIYNIQVIVRDGALYNPCFLPVYVRLTVQRNTHRPEFTNSSSVVSVLENHALNTQFILLRVSNQWYTVYDYDFIY